MFPYGSRTSRRGVSYKRLHHDPDFDDAMLLSSDDEEPAPRSLLPFVELKYWDLSRGGDTGSVGGDPVPSGAGLDDWIFNPTLGICSVPVRGDGAQEYTGKAIRIKSWAVRGSVWLQPTLNALEGLRPRWVFMALVLDTQTNGTQCTSDQILQFIYTQNNMGHCAPFQNMAYSKRFRLLKRKTWDLSPKTLSIDIGIAPDPNAWQCAGRLKTFDFFIPLDVICNFKTFPVDSEIASCVDNSLHVVMGTNTINGLLVNQPAITAGYVSRIRFEDLQ